MLYNRLYLQYIIYFSSIIFIQLSVKHNFIINVHIKGDKQNKACQNRTVSLEYTVKFLY